MDAVARPHEQRQAEADRAHTIAAVAKQEVAARFWALHDALATAPPPCSTRSTSRPSNSPNTSPTHRPPSTPPPLN